MYFSPSWTVLKLFVVYILYLHYYNKFFPTYVVRIKFHQIIKRVRYECGWDAWSFVWGWLSRVSLSRVCAIHRCMCWMSGRQPHKLNGIILMRLGRRVPPPADARDQSPGQRLTALIPTPSALHTNFIWHGRKWVCQIVIFQSTFFAKLDPWYFCVWKSCYISFNTRVISFIFALERLIQLK